MKQCFAKTYTYPVWMAGTIVCWGFNSQPPCRFLEKCVRQFEEDIPKRKFNFLLKRVQKANKIL